MPMPVDEFDLHSHEGADGARVFRFTVPPEKRMEPVNMQWEGGQVVGAVGAITGRSYRVESFPSGGAKVHYTDDDMLDPNDPRFAEFDRD